VCVGMEWKQHRCALKQEMHAGLALIGWGEGVCVSVVLFLPTNECATGTGRRGWVSGVGAGVW
jgi:hypothetical protein